MNRRLRPAGTPSLFRGGDGAHDPARGLPRRAEFQGSNRSRHAKPTALTVSTPSMQQIKPWPDGPRRLQSWTGPPPLIGNSGAPSPTQQALLALRKIPQDVL